MIKVYKNKDVSVTASYTLPYSSDIHMASGPSSERVYLAQHILAVKAASEEDKSLDIIAQAKAQAEEILQAAKAEAEEILSNANAQAQQLISSARNSGYEDGYNEAKQLLEQKLAQLESLSKNLLKENEHYMEECWQNVKLLAIEAARKIVGEALPVEDVFMAVMKKTALSMPKVEKLKILLSEREYEIAARNVQEIRALFDGMPQVEILKDSQSKKGKFVLITDDREVDISLNTQFAKINEVFAQI